MLAIFAGITGISLLVAEFLLWLNSPTHYYVWEPGRQSVYYPDPKFMRGIESPSKLSINAMGIRGEALPTKAGKLILAVGASTTLQLYNDDNRTWPHLLQQGLQHQTGMNIWVGNIGRPAIPLAANLAQLKELLPRLPPIEMVVMMVGGVNAEQALLNRPLNTGEAQIKQLAFGVHPRRPIDQFFSGPSILWARLRTAYIGLTIDSDMLMLEDGSGITLGLARQARRNARIIIDQGPDLTQALEHFNATLAELKQFLDTRQVELVLVTQPYLYSDSLSPKDEALIWGGALPASSSSPNETPYLSNQVRADAATGFNNAILQFCGQQQLLCVDLDKSMQDRPDLFIDHIHFSDAGSAYAASVIADHLTNPLLSRNQSCLLSGQTDVPNGQTCQVASELQ